MALGIVRDSDAKAFADLKAELEKERAAREMAQDEVDTLTRASLLLKFPSLKRRLNT
jgi:hypothetical protein